MRRQGGETEWKLVVVLAILGLLWFSIAGPATCRAYGGPSTVTVQQGHQ